MAFAVRVFIITCTLCNVENRQTVVTLGSSDSLAVSEKSPVGVDWLIVHCHPRFTKARIRKEFPDLSRIDRA